MAADSGVPVGLVHVSVGGTPIEAWIPRAALASNPQLSHLLENWLENPAYPAWCRERGRHNIGAWLTAPTATPPHHPFEPGFLFAAGMRLQSSAASGANLESRAIDTVNELDATIGVIRETIFRLTSSEPDLYDEIATMVHGFRTVSGDPIVLTIDGDSSAVPEPVAEQLLPSLNELVSNAVRHGEAGAISVTLAVGDEVVLVVVDDGVGFGPSADRGFGLGNIGARARNLGGRLDIDSVPNRGTKVTWRVPLSGPAKS